MGNPFSTEPLSVASQPMSGVEPILMMAGGIIFATLGALHALFVVLDITSPLRLVPANRAVAKAMSETSLQLSSGRTNMWSAWVGFNFSHSLGLLLFAGLAICMSIKLKPIPSSYLALMTFIGCIYSALAALYWFRAPLIGVAIGTSCFLGAWVCSLR